MKKFVSLLSLVVLFTFAATSCSKDNTVVPAELTEETSDSSAQIYGLDLCFDAPADVTEATVFFFDEHGQQIAVDRLGVPASSAESVAVSFLAEARPEYLYTEGLQNYGDNGLLRLPGSSIETRAGGNAVLVIIAH